MSETDVVKKAKREASADRNTSVVRFVHNQKQKYYSVVTVNLHSAPNINGKAVSSDDQLAAAYCYQLMTVTPVLDP